MKETILLTDHKPTFTSIIFKAGSKVTVISNRGDTWIVQFKEHKFSIKKEKLEDGAT